MQGRIWVPEGEKLRLRIIQLHHESPTASHRGSPNTLELVRRTYYWPYITKDVKQFVRACRICKTTKSPRHAYEGLLKAMPTLYEPWKEIAVDFVVDLPPSESFEGVFYTNILTITDRFTKECHTLPIKSMTARNTARVFLKYGFSRHGLPDFVTSDCGPQFVSDFWHHLMELLQI